MRVRKFHAGFLAPTILAPTLIAALIAVPAPRAQANEAAAALGGAILGGIIVNEVHKNKQRQRAATTTRGTTGISSAQRQENREVQTALNYFGYNVGTVDGALGRRSRAGISSYQADMGYPVDGYLNEDEKAFLLSSHQRALASAHVQPYAQIVATQGQAGLLRTYRNEQLGIATPQVAPQAGGSYMAAAPTAPAPYVAPAPMPTSQETVAARADTGGAAGSGALPGFGFAQNASASASHLCNETQIRSATNGGPQQPGQIADAGLALDEQFCLARTAAIAEAARIEAGLDGLDPDQIAAQCDGLSQAMAPQVASLTSTGPAAALAGTESFLQSSGHPLAQLVTGGKICLGRAYRNDDAEMALGAALLVAAAGQPAYGELVSHHLRAGMGAPAAPQQASGWMQLALDGAAQGGTPVLNQDDARLAVLSAAASGAATLPVFPTAASKN